MSVEVEKRIPGTVGVKEMKDGQIGQIVCAGDSYDGRIVQMIRGYHGGHGTLQSIGDRSGLSWDGTSSFRIRLLEPGEVIKVVSN